VPARATPQDIVYAGVVYEIQADGQLNFHVLEKKNEELSYANRDGYFYHPDPKLFIAILGRLWKISASMADKVQAYDELIKEVREELERHAQAENVTATVPAGSASDLEDDDLASDVDDEAKLNEPQAEAKFLPCFAVVTVGETLEQELKTKANRQFERAQRNRAAQEEQTKDSPAKHRCNLFQMQQHYKVLFGSLYSRGQVLPSRKVVKKAYSRKALSAHPDKGGDPAVFRELEEANTKIMQVLADGIRPYTLTEMLWAKIWLGVAELAKPQRTDDLVLRAKQVTAAYDTSMRILASDITLTAYPRGIKASRLAWARDVLLDIATTDVLRFCLHKFNEDTYFPGAFQ